MNPADIEKIIRENIDRTVHLSLATVHDNSPWVCEVHFAYDDSLNLYYRSRASRRHSQEIASNPKVAGNIIDRYELGQPVIGIYFEGDASLLKDSTEQAKAAKCLSARLKITDDILGEAANEDGHQFYKVAVANWYVFGAFNGQPSQKYTLPWNGVNK